jgi:hypothetical protein
MAAAPQQANVPGRQVQYWASTIADWKCGADRHDNDRGQRNNEFQRVVLNHFR